MPFPELAFVMAQFPDLLDMEELARGGQKVVYSARSNYHGRIVLKLTKPDDRAFREVIAVKESGFSHVPQILSHGHFTSPDEKFLYLIEERVEGETLRKRLLRQTPLPVEETMQLLRTLLQTAVEIEACHLVHRDIKPENIMVESDGRYWLLDFGIARHLDKESLTKTAESFGPATLGYAAPEQLRNLKRDVDIRADLFAIGLVTYECLAGQNPYTDGAQGVMEILKRVSTIQPPPLSIPGDSSGELYQFISTLMARPASLRPRSASEALDWFSKMEASVQL